MSVRRAPERLLVLAPIEPAASGNGLAMRTELFRRSAPAGVDVQTIVVPVAGRVAGARASHTTYVAANPTRARAGAIALAAVPSWRERLARLGTLPPLARAASPGLADAVVRAHGGSGSVGLHVMRAYMAPLGVAVAERLDASWATLDLDDDDAAFARSLGDTEGAAAYERLLEVFGPLFDGLSAASASEADAIGKRHGLAVAHLPNAVALAPHPAPSMRTRSTADASLLFVGNLTYPPNAEAARLVAGEILPAVRQRLGGRVGARLVGSHHGDLDDLRGPDVELTGFVPDLAPLYASADVVVAPLRSGGGTRIKLLEAFAHSVPVVASPRAAAGLDAVDGRHLLLADDSEGAGAAVVALLTNAELAARLVDQAWQLVRDRYCIEAVTPLIGGFFDGAARAAGRRAQSSSS